MPRQHKTFFTSDTHFGHKNILKYANRPFPSVEDMDHVLITNWNRTVSPADHIYHLGDFGLWRDGKGKNHAAEILDQLNGNIHFILGNHDMPVRREDVYAYFENKASIPLNKYAFNIHEVNIPDDEMEQKQKIVLCHFPLEVWNKRHFGAWHLHGHCHGTLPSADYQARMDVGVDAVGQFTEIDPSIEPFAPIEYEQVKAIMTRKVFKPLDHHQGR